MAVLNLEEIKKNFITLGKELGFIISDTAEPTSPGIMLVGRADSKCFPLNWVLQTPPPCLVYETNQTFLTPEMEMLQNSIPQLYPADGSHAPVRMLFMDYEEATRTRYAVIFTDSYTFPDVVDFNGAFAMTAKLEPDDKYSWLNWLTIGCRRYPIPDSYVKDIYMRVLGTDNIPLRSVYENRNDATFTLPVSSYDGYDETPETDPFGNPLCEEDDNDTDNNEEEDTDNSEEDE